MSDNVDLSEFRAEDVSTVSEAELYQAKQRFHSFEHPRAILLAGQPGAGKTVLSTMFLDQFNGDAAFVNADDFRRYHPNYRALYQSFGSDSVQMTSKFSSAITNRLIVEYAELHMNLIIEGTGRTVKVPLETAALLHAKGYSVEIAVISTRPEMSLASTLIRFYQMNELGTIPRATAIEAHDATVAALPDNLDALAESKRFSRITIWNREQKLVWDSAQMTECPSRALKDNWMRPWSADEIESLARQIQALRRQEELLHLNQGAAISELERRTKSVRNTMQIE